MKQWVLAMLVAVVSLGVLVQDAEARRFGGARSSGISRDSGLMKRDAVPAKQAAPTQAAPAPGAATPPRAGMSRWLGPLAGLAAGIGLASLFSHLGMGEGMANVLMLVALAMLAVFVVRFLLRKMQGGDTAPTPLRYATVGPADAPVNISAPTAQGGAASATSANGSAQGAPDGVAGTIPEGFDVSGFLRQAKLNFIRLQAANDRGDLADMRQFCAPEMAAEIQMQLAERAPGEQQTDVLNLDAQLLDVSDAGEMTLASVRFYGQIREERHGPAEEFSEVWHLSRPRDGSRGWVIAGIQQH